MRPLFWTAATCLASRCPGRRRSGGPIVLTEAQARCLAAQADSYIAQDRPVYVVVIPPEDACPIPPAGTESLAGESNAMGAGIALKEGDSSGFLVMTEAQLTCLRSRLAELIQPEGNGKVRLLLEKCG